MDFSIVIPVCNESGNVEPLGGEIRDALGDAYDYEVVFVDDGSTDDTAARIAAMAGDWPRVRLVRHARNAGQSAGLRSGVAAARAPWIVTMDGDRQNDPADIPALWQAAHGADGGGTIMIVGHRTNRRDTWSRRVGSRIANRVRGGLLQDQTPDSACGLKLFPRALYLDMPYFDHMHRFLPALARRHGATVRSLPVNHRARHTGTSHYTNWGRLWVGIVDLLGVMWLIRRGGLPTLLPPTDENTDGNKDAH